MAGGRTTQWRSRQVRCVVAMAIFGHNISTSASRHYRFTRIFKPSALLIANGSGRQTAATCTSPCREPVLPTECAIVVGCSGTFRTLFPRVRSYRPGRFPPNPVRLVGLGVLVGARLPPRTDQNRGFEARQGYYVQPDYAGCAGCTQTVFPRTFLFLSRWPARAARAVA